MRRCRIALFCAVIGFLTSAVRTEVRAQAAPPIQAPVSVDNRISADSSPYRIEWNGTSGVFIRNAFAQEPEIRQPLTFLHTDAGPAGFAKYLAWFLARDTHGFSLLWCYLNASGNEFDCWLYRFPSNQLTSLHFTGAYQYAALREPTPALPLSDFKLNDFPPYVGPEFIYKDWTKLVGALPQLDLQPIRPASAPAPGPGGAAAGARTLAQISVRPLHQVEVGSSNGWREGGWHELHALATDGAGDPYYLILYSNTQKGYAVDLKRAQIYTADFGARVSFQDRTGAIPSDDPLHAEPEIKVRRYDRHEIVLTTTEKAGNPYIDTQVGVEFRGPDTKPVVVPGFWDGGNTFRVRFTPQQTGTWTWKSLSKTADLNGQTGAFDCIREDTGVKGFVNVQPDHRDTHHFGFADGEPFLPVLLREPQPLYVTMPAQGGSSAAVPAGIRLARLDATPVQDETATFIAYQRFLNAASQKGFNRLVGGAVLGPAATKLVRTNEGGPAFEGADLDKINPAFFQWMDRRVAYCNSRGIVPDIGIGTLENALFTTYKPASMYRFWAYVVARYASYDVQWNLFEPGEAPISETTQKGAEQFAELTRLYDPNHHPITSTLAGGLGTAASVAVPNRGPRTAGPGGPPSDTGTQHGSGSAIGGAASVPQQQAASDLPWEDVITLQGGDISALPWYTSVKKPVVFVERPTIGKDAALSPDAMRHRMWETRMRGAYWSPGLVPTADVTFLDAQEIQWAAYCGDLFRRTRFARLNPRPEMLGGPAESAADRKRRKKAEAAARLNSPPANDTQPPIDFDPFDPESFGDLPPLPAPKPTPMFVLADPAREYLVYFEQGGTLLLDLLEATGKVQVTWFNPRTGEYSTPKQILGGAYISFTAPDANDWVLYASRL